MKTLDKKLLRDLWRMKGQVIAIIMVIALGVLMLVMMNGLVLSLEETKRAYYERHRLAEIFAPLKRAPKSLIRDLNKIEGVAAVSERVVGRALINITEDGLPVSAQAVSLPDFGEPRLNDLYLTAGRRINPSHEDEIILLDNFAKFHNLTLGSRVSATMNGSLRSFTLVGLARSPEFLYSTPPGEFVPDDARFAVIWMSESALAAAYGMQGAFNEVLFAISPKVNSLQVLDQIDRYLEAYGGLGAYTRQDHISNRFINDEITGLRVSSRTVPPVFLLVAAFLLNIVISRMIQAERGQIGLLKSFGYSDVEVSGHYFKFILIIAVSGGLLGCILGVMAGRSLAVVYQQYYTFPFLLFQIEIETFLIGLTSSVIAASAGGAMVLRGIFKLTPAVAMQPPAPADYSRIMALPKFCKVLLDQPGKMVIRRVIRQPGRTAGAIIGIAAGMALSVAMLSVMNSFDRALAVSFGVIDRSDLNVSFTDAVSDRAIYDLQSIDGVIEVEPYRSIPVVLRNGYLTHRGAITGLIQDARLSRALDKSMTAINPSKKGVILGSALADILQVKLGETLTVDVREERRPILQLPVVGIAETLIGSPAYMDLRSLNTALGDASRVSGAYLRIDAQQSDVIYRQIKDMPLVAGVSVKSDARRAFEKLMDNSAGAIRYVMSGIAALITFGIVYNTARIAYAERLRDLSSLRVIGFTRGETAFVLLAELGLITLLALPIGGVLGYYLGFVISEGFSTDLYRVPIMFIPESYGLAAVAVISASVASGWIVKRDIDRIDLVSALKIRE